MEMIEHQKRAFELKRQMFALTDAIIGRQRYKLPPCVLNALRDSPEPWTSTPPTAKTGMLASWQDAITALLRDPEAAI